LRQILSVNLFSLSLSVAPDLTKDIGLKRRVHRAGGEILFRSLSIWTEELESARQEAKFYSGYCQFGLKS
jgi:hypothetical protein